MKKIVKLKRKIAGLLLAVCMTVGVLPTTVLAANDTFTITYKTNADVEMGTIQYNVGGTDSLPGINEFGTKFDSFIQCAKEKGGVYVPNIFWYEDKDFTTPAQFPQGEKGKNYTLYCKLTVGWMTAGSVRNGAADKSYADVGGSIQPYLSISGQIVTGRNDAYEGTKAIFEKKNDAGEWIVVPDEYYIDKGGTEWTTMIYFSDVSDSGIYRLRDVRYTATDNDGNVLYYVDAPDTSRSEQTVNITPVELAVTGVTAQDRNCNGTNEVQLSGGTLTGILYNDDVSFDLGTGTVTDYAAGNDKPVAANIILTGTKAGNYTLKQPQDITVTISHALDNTGWHSDENEHWNTCICGEKMNTEEHTGGEATCTVKTICEICSKEYGEVNADNHSWDETVYEWDADGKSCTAKRICKNDNTHIETANAVVTSKQTKAPTCTENGETTYTATFDSDWAVRQTKVIADVTVVDHSFKWVTDKEAAIGVAGSKHEECTVCAYKKAPVEIPALEEVEYPPIIEQPEGGKVSVDNPNPQPGEKVTITPQPDKKYRVGSITIINQDGNPVEVTENGDGTYSFVQPEGEVTIKVVFELKSETKPETKPESKPGAEKPKVENTPKTGDNSNFGIWFILMAAGGIMLTRVAVCHNRMKRK